MDHRIKPRSSIETPKIRAMTDHACPASSPCPSTTAENLGVSGNEVCPTGKRRSGLNHLPDAGDITIHIQALAALKNAEARTLEIDAEQLAPWRESLQSTGLVAARVPVRGRRKEDPPSDAGALALREDLRRDYKLTTSGELLLADLVVAATREFQDVLQVSVSEGFRGDLEAIRALIELRSKSADHLLKVLTALRELTAPAISVKVGQADQVNVANQQINVGPPMGMPPANDSGKVRIG